MQFVDTRESYGYGRYPNNSEFAVIISIVDGSSLPQKYDPMANNDEVFTITNYKSEESAAFVGLNTKILTPIIELIPQRKQQACI